MIREWLRREDIHQFDHLHKMALSNQIIMESRHYVGFRGLGIAYAFIVCHVNPQGFRPDKMVLVTLHEQNQAEVN